MPQLGPEEIFWLILLGVSLAPLPALLYMLTLYRALGAPARAGPALQAAADT